MNTIPLNKPFYIRTEMQTDLSQSHTTVSFMKNKLISLGMMTVDNLTDLVLDADVYKKVAFYESINSSLTREFNMLSRWICSRIYTAVRGNYVINTMYDDIDIILQDTYEAYIESISDKILDIIYALYQNMNYSEAMEEILAAEILKEKSNTIAYMGKAIGEILSIYLKESLLL